MDVYHQVKLGLLAPQSAPHYPESLTFHTGFPVVRTDGKAYGHVVTKFRGRTDYQIFLGRGLRSLVELRYYTLLSLKMISFVFSTSLAAKV